ncbi:MAG: membrane protein insertion efficiency factor YidD [Pseudomonadota bacterium]
MSALRRRISKGLLKAYKLTLSPVFSLFGARCRHVPTCSEYCAGCVSRHGVWAGLWMTFARLSRCRPGGSSGYDPVPEETKSAPFYAPWKYGDWALTERPFPDEGQLENMKRQDP